MKSSSESNQPQPDGAVRVTFTIPTLAADLLKQLADGGNQGLKKLGVVSVEINGATGRTLPHETNQTTNRSCPRRLSSLGHETGDSFFDSAIMFCPTYPAYDTTERTTENIRQYLGQQTTNDESSLRRLIFKSPSLSSSSLLQRNDRQLPSFVENRFPFQQQQRSGFGKRQQRPTGAVDGTAFWRAPPSPSYRPRKQNPHHLADRSEFVVAGPLSLMYARSPPYSSNPCSPRMRGGLRLHSPLLRSSTTDTFSNVEHKLTGQQSSHPSSSSSSSPFLMSLFHPHNNPPPPPSVITNGLQSVGPFEMILASSSSNAGVKKRKRRNQKELTALQYDFPPLDRSDARVPSFNRDTTTSNRSHDDDAAGRSSFIDERNSLSPSCSMGFDVSKRCNASSSSQPLQNNLSPRAAISEGNKLHHLPMLSAEESWSDQIYTKNAAFYRNPECDDKPCNAEKPFISARKQISDVAKNCGSYYNMNNGFLSSFRTEMVWSPNDDNEIKRLLIDVNDERRTRKKSACMTNEDDDKDLIGTDNFQMRTNSKSNRICGVRTKRRRGGKTTTTTTSESKRRSIHDEFDSNELNFERNFADDDKDEEKRVFLKSFEGFPEDGNDRFLPNARDVVASTFFAESRRSSWQPTTMATGVRNVGTDNSWPTKSDESFLAGFAAKSRDSSALEMSSCLASARSLQITNPNLVGHEDAMRWSSLTSTARVGFRSDEDKTRHLLGSSFLSAGNERQKTNDSSIVSALLRSNLVPTSRLHSNKEFFSDSVGKSVKLNDRYTIRLRHLDRNEENSSSFRSENENGLRMITNDSSQKSEDIVMAIDVDSTRRSDDNSSNRSDKVKTFDVNDVKSSDVIKSRCSTVESLKMRDVAVAARLVRSAVIADTSSGGNGDSECSELTNSIENSISIKDMSDVAPSPTTTKTFHDKVLTSLEKSDETLIQSTALANVLRATVINNDDVLKDSVHQITTTTADEASKLTDDIIGKESGGNSDDVSSLEIDKTIDVKCFDYDSRPNGTISYSELDTRVSRTLTLAYPSSSSDMTISKGTVVRGGEHSVETETANECDLHEPYIFSRCSMNPSSSSNLFQANDVLITVEEEERCLHKHNSRLVSAQNDVVRTIVDKRRSNKHLSDVLLSRANAIVEDIQGFVAVSKTKDNSSEIATAIEKRVRHSCVRQLSPVSSSFVEVGNQTLTDKDVSESTSFDDSSAISDCRPPAKKCSTQNTTDLNCLTN